MSAARVALLALAALAGCSGCSRRSYAASAACRPGETCGYASRSHWTSNCCGYALGPFTDAETCRSACATQASEVGRSGLGCLTEGQKLCDAVVDDWTPCNGLTGAREAGGQCVLATGATLPCLCR